MSISKHFAVRDTLTGTVYPQPNRIIAEKVAEMHGHSEFVLSAPPADDVREACVRLLGHVFHGEYSKRPATVVEVSDLRLVLDALTAIEIRPRGTVTDTEVKMSRNVLRDAGYVIPMHLVRAALEAAREVHS